MSVQIIGNGHVRDIFYAQPDWSDDLESAFEYRGETYYLSEFEYIGRHMPDWMQAYDGYTSDSFFSGILIKLDDEYGEGVKVYTYIC